MDAEAPTRTQKVTAGVFWLIVLLAAGYVAPRFVGALLMLFSVLVFVLAVIGLIRPSVVRLSDRMAAVWVWAVSVGLFVGGGMLMAPPNGESTASDVPPTAVRVPEPEASGAARSGLSERMMTAEARGACNVRLSDAARFLVSQGAMYRWMSPDLDVRFPGRRETGDPDVVTYWGRALQFRDEDGSWVRATYECDFNHDTGEIVDVRTREG